MLYSFESLFTLLFVLFFSLLKDAIEEDELNEKSCIQVLRILVNKANEEIMELEGDVVILQSKLTWSDKDWCDLCSATLKEKIDHLNISMLTLKKEISGDEHIFGVELLKNKKPVERLHDILKSLWDNCFLLEKNQVEFRTFIFFCLFSLKNKKIKKINQISFESPMLRNLHLV